MSETVRSRIVGLLHESLGIECAEIEADGKREIFVKHSDGKIDRERLDASLGGDSLDWVELVMMAEEEFGIEIPDEDAERTDLNSVDGLTAYIEQRLAA